MDEACLELGVREAPDLNAPDAQAGVVGPMPHNRYKEVRLGTLVTYIRAARARPNLMIRADSQVDRIVLQAAARRASLSRPAPRSGGRLCRRHRDQRRRLQQPGDPAALGIGPAEWLRPLGVAVVADLPVGRNLLDHPGFPMLFRAEGLGVTTGRFFAANVRGPANSARRAGMANPSFPIDEEEHTAGFWTYLTRQEATGEVRIRAPTRAPAADRPPLQHPPAGSRPVRRRARLRQGDVRHAACQPHRDVWLDDLDKPIAEALAEGMGPAHHQAGNGQDGPGKGSTAVVGA